MAVFDGSGRRTTTCGSMLTIIVQIELENRASLPVLGLC